MHKIVQAQRQFFFTHQTKNIDFRIEQLKRLKHALKENEESLVQAVYDDMNKPSFECLTSELLFLQLEIDIAIKNIKRWSRKKYVSTNLINFPATSYIVPEPLGVVLIIGPWNYPYQLSIAPAITALAAGNTVILKPSELATHSSKAIAQLINYTFDPAYFKVIEGDAQLTTELLKEKFDKIFFIGSTTVGKIIAKAAAEQLTPVALELGGKSPTIFTEGAHTKNAINRLVWAKFLNAGQTCISPDYVFVHKNDSADFLALVKKEIISRNYSIEKANYSLIINQKHTARIVRLIEGNTVYYGGKYDIEKRYIEPTVLVDVSIHSMVMQEEIFGPILPVIVYENLDEVIDYIGTNPSPLAVYLFTKDKAIKEKILRELKFGGGAINDALMHATNHNLGFGGVGNSGYGSYQGKSGFVEFSHYKSILDKPTWWEPRLKYTPTNESKLNWLRWLIKKN